MLLTRRLFSKIIFEAILLEIKKEDILNDQKYPFITLYSAVIDRIKNQGKYLGFLEKMLDSYVNKEDGPFKAFNVIAYGEIIFMILMHEKYSKSKGVIPAEYLDPNRIPSYEVLTSIIEDTDAKHMSANNALYTSLTGMDKEATKAMKEVDNDSSEDATEGESALKDLNQQMVNPEGLKPGLILHNIIQGEDGKEWAIYRPYSVAGAQAIGVGSWCTVYGSAWSTYAGQGITLYYIAKWDPNREYRSDYYSQDECYKNPEVYNNNLSIGFSGDRLQIPGSAGGSSVWASQEGVTYENLIQRMGSGTANAVVDYIKAHFAEAGPSMSNDERGNDKEEAERMRQETKVTRAQARNKKVFVESFESIGDPDKRLLFLFETLVSPHLDYPVLEYIIKRNVPTVRDSRLRMTVMGQKNLITPSIIGIIQSDVHLRLGPAQQDLIKLIRLHTLNDPYLLLPSFHNDKNDLVKEIVHSWRQRGELSPSLSYATWYPREPFGSLPPDGPGMYGKWFEKASFDSSITVEEWAKIESLIDKNDLLSLSFGTTGHGIVDEFIGYVLYHLANVLKDPNSPARSGAPVILSAFESGKYDDVLEKYFDVIVSGGGRRILDKRLSAFLKAYIFFPDNRNEKQNALLQRYVNEFTNIHMRESTSKDARKFNEAYKVKGRLAKVIRKIEGGKHNPSAKTKTLIDEWADLKNMTSSTLYSSFISDLDLIIPGSKEKFAQMSIRVNDLEDEIVESLEADYIEWDDNGPIPYERISNAMYADDQDTRDTILIQAFDGLVDHEDIKKTWSTSLEFVNDDIVRRLGGDDVVIKKAISTVESGIQFAHEAFMEHYRNEDSGLSEYDILIKSCEPYVEKINRSLYPFHSRVGLNTEVAIIEEETLLRKVWFRAFIGASNKAEERGNLEWDNGYGGIKFALKEKFRLLAHRAKQEMITYNGKTYTVNDIVELAQKTENIINEECAKSIKLCKSRGLPTNQEQFLNDIDIVAYLQSLSQELGI